MIAPILAGLGALALMSNPPRRRRRRSTVRRNPGKVIVLTWSENDGIELTGRQVWRDGILRDEHRLVPKARALVFSSDTKELSRAKDYAAREGYRVRVMADSEDVLERARALEAKRPTRTNPPRATGPTPHPATVKQAYNQGYAEGRDATGDLERRGGWPTPTDLDTRRAPTKFTIAWRKGYAAGRRAQPQRNPVTKTQLLALLKAATNVLHAQRSGNFKREQAMLDRVSALLVKYGLTDDPMPVVEQARAHLARTSVAAVMGGIAGRSGR